MASALKCVYAQSNLPALAGSTLNFITTGYSSILFESPPENQSHMLDMLPATTIKITAQHT